MRSLFFTSEKLENFFKTAATVLLIMTLVGAGDTFAQYKGAPVRKDRLIRALRSKQLQTGDIVTIINRNGVDFELTAETKKNLVAAGARPEIIEAIASNSRAVVNNSLARTNRKNNKTRFAAPDYNDLLERAMYSYKDQRNANAAVRLLKTAAKANPVNPAAYQMLGFVYLYGMNDYRQAENSMRESFANGGSAVFRVFHDDNGKFSHRCAGSLYVSQTTLRYESDDNIHTFETSTTNIDKIKLDTVSVGDWKKRSTFKVTLKFGKEEAKFRFAPLTGLQGESQMVARFIHASNPSKIPLGSVALR